MSYKIVFSDIDGTLVDSSEKIHPNTKEYLARFSAKGVPFVLVSARMPSSVAGVQHQIGVTAPYIAYSGALICDKDGATLWDKSMSVATAVAVRKEIDAFSDNVVSFGFSNDSWITDVDDGSASLYLEPETIALKPLVGKIGDVLPETAPVHKILCSGKPETLDALQSRLIPMFPTCSFVKSLPQYLEIMTAGVSKSSAAAILCDRLHIAQSETIAFGDNFNDTDLLEYAGLGVAMGNAPDAVKKIANTVAPSVDDEGVRLTLEKLFK